MVAAMALSESRSCDPGGRGLLLPLGGDDENNLPASLRAVVYGIMLLYCFLGVSIVANLFMDGIERITSTTRKKVDKSTGQEIEVPVWNKTVANLTLMALGSSAPEILLSVVEICGKGFYSGELGPGTIVGSAAFNLLVIIAVCINCIPDGEVRRVSQDPVFIVTAVFSVFAYVWLLFIVQFSSKDVVEPWEGTITFMLFPVLVGVSFMADKRWEELGGAPAEATQADDVEALRAAIQDSAGSLPVSVVGRATTPTPKKARPAANASQSAAAFLAADESQSGAAAVSLAREAQLSVADEFCPQALSPSDPETAHWLGGMSPSTGRRRGSSSKSRRSRKEAVAALSGSRRTSHRSSQQQGAPDGSPRASPRSNNSGVKRSSRSPGGAGSGGQSRFSAVSATAQLDFQSAGYHAQDVQTPHQQDASARSHPSTPVLLGSPAGSAKRARDCGSESSRQTPSICGQLQQSAGKAVGEPEPIELQAHEKAEDDKNLDDERPWRMQVVQAFYCNGSEEEQQDATAADWMLHVATLPWKLFYAVSVPPAEYAGGWACFCMALVQIGLLTAVVGDLADLFGCVAGVKDSVTAITFVALGTSLPDLFASKSSAANDETADAAIVNVTGSNSVNVFLGIGLPWMLAALYWQVAGATEEWKSKYPDLLGTYPGGAFVVRGGDLSFSVSVFTLVALVALGTLRVRRLNFGGELGGPRGAKRFSAMFLILLWLYYVGLSVWKAYDQDADVMMMVAAAIMAAVSLMGVIVFVGLAIQFLEPSRSEPDPSSCDPAFSNFRTREEELLGRVSSAVASMHQLSLAMSSEHAKACQSKNATQADASKAAGQPVRPMDSE